MGRRRSALSVKYYLYKYNQRSWCLYAVYGRDVYQISKKVTNLTISKRSPDEWPTLKNLRTYAIPLDRLMGKLRSMLDELVDPFWWDHNNNGRGEVCLGHAKDLCEEDEDEE